MLESISSLRTSTRPACTHCQMMRSNKYNLPVLIILFDHHPVIPAKAEIQSYRNYWWLPIYFGILRTGALAVPLNFRFAAKTIKHCTETAGANRNGYEVGPIDIRVE
jgi:acyl-CoA synthetase (AMP-forming)/AMP-acid ligase II